ncbi:MAG: prepilin-type N-terminal cleavage/methylation domain-containing protein [Candidatus Veblenbacteria bacterium]|nr:prepilin-type N-terminal cleavage/methylation domain-containing protein [Candidatus Veblenbacteria bacterium]MDZ4230110.1 prepilin-type N-terminal cleavage/methylation domain-containing protein [Candidatus Veblenbacteria bacterium]
MTNRLPQGFTLIETVVYLGLLAIMLSGVIVTAYNVFESSDRSQTKSTVQLEGDFLVAKIDWALSGAQAINAPTNVGSQLSVNRWNGSNVETVVIEADPVTGTDVSLARSGNPSLPLNGFSTEVSGLTFTHLAGSGTNPESVRADFTVGARTANGQWLALPFSITSYLRK